MTRVRRLGVWLCAGDRARGWGLLGFAAVQIALAAWDLPSSFGWENDAVAPRDLFEAMAENLTPGHGFRYPLLHPLLTMLLCLPVLAPAALVAVARSGWSYLPVRDAVLAVPVMTACALIARALAVLMATVTVGVAGRWAERHAGRVAGRWACVFAAGHAALAYYGRTGNLDGPALMWTVLALERMTAALEDPATGRAAMVFAAVAMATKDQSYASFLLLGPAFLVVSWRRPHAAPLRDFALALGVYLVLAGALFNPTGFVYRWRTMGGPASGDYRAFTKNAAGVTANLHDVLLTHAHASWALPVALLTLAGLAVTLVRLRGRPTMAAPLLLALGNLFGFALVVGRDEARFTLPLAWAASVYAGLATPMVFSAAVSGRRWLARSLQGALLACAGAHFLALALTQRGDSRRVVEAALLRLPGGDPPRTLETYGPLVYLPRLDRVLSARSAGLIVQRVGTDAPARRNPLPGVIEVQDAIADAPRRSPDYLLIPEAYALGVAPPSPEPGRQIPPVARREGEGGVAAFVRTAAADRLPGYHLNVVETQWPRWAAAVGLQPVRLHRSTGYAQLLLARSVFSR